MIKKAKKNKSNVIVIGFDVSPSSIAGCAKSYDSLLDKIYGPVWVSERWNKVDYAQWDKLKAASNIHNLVFDLQNKLGAGGIVKELAHVHIGVEEPPARVMNARAYREQCEIEGAVVASLLKFGYTNVYSVNVKQWQKLVAEDLGMKLNKEFTKFTVAEWVEEVYGKKWKPLIRHNKYGLIPKPKDSKAKPAQPDDRVDATGIMEFCWEKASSTKVK